MDQDTNTAILQRLEQVVQSLQDNSIKMGQLLSVHAEKLDQQEKADDILFAKIDHLHKDLHQRTEEIKKGCERDILLVKGKIDVLERRVYMVLGVIAAMLLLTKPELLKLVRPLISTSGDATMVAPSTAANALPGSPIRFAAVPKTSELLD